MAGDVVVLIAWRVIVVEAAQTRSVLAANALVPEPLPGIDPDEALAGERNASAEKTQLEMDNLNQQGSLRQLLLGGGSTVQPAGTAPVQGAPAAPGTVAGEAATAATAPAVAASEPSGRGPSATRTPPPS